MASGTKMEPGYTCLSEAKASHLQSMWAEVSSSPPHLLHSGLSLTASLDENAPQDIMPSKKANNKPGFCPVTGQKRSLGTQAGSQN